MTLNFAPFAAVLSLALLSACVVEDRVILQDSYPRPYYYVPPPAVYYYAPPRRHHHHGYGYGSGWGPGYRRW